MNPSSGTSPLAYYNADYPNGIFTDSDLYIIYWVYSLLCYCAGHLYSMFRLFKNIIWKMFDLFDCLAIFDATVTIEYWPTSHINSARYICYWPYSEVNMAKFLFCILWTETKSRSIKVQTKYRLISSHLNRASLHSQ